MQNLFTFFHEMPYPVMCLAGLCLRLWIGKRRFDRRSMGGLQQFSDYFTAVITLFLERLARWSGTILMLCGLYGWLFR